MSNRCPIQVAKASATILRQRFSTHQRAPVQVGNGKDMSGGIPFNLPCRMTLPMAAVIAASCTKFETSHDSFLSCSLLFVFALTADTRLPQIDQRFTFGSGRLTRIPLTACSSPCPVGSDPRTNRTATSRTSSLHPSFCLSVFSLREIERPHFPSRLCLFYSNPVPTRFAILFDLKSFSILPPSNFCPPFSARGFRLALMTQKERTSLRVSKEALGMCL